MINLELTEAELVFLQRLIGHNTTWSPMTGNLYGKLADKTDSLGITNFEPVNLKDVSKESWYGDNRMLLKLEE